MLIQQFNAKYKIGSNLAYTENGKTILATLRWPAEVLEGGKNLAVIWVHGRVDAVELNKVIHL